MLAVLGIDVVNKSYRVEQRRRDHSALMGVRKLYCLNANTRDNAWFSVDVSGSPRRYRVLYETSSR